MFASLRRAVCLVVFLGLVPAMAWAAPLTHSITHGDGRIVIDVACGDVTLTEQDGGILPEMEGCEPSSSPGAPVLPVRTFTLALPPNADPASVSIELTDAKTETLPLPEGKRVLPGPPAMEWNGSAALEDWGGAVGVVDGFSVPIYTADAFYPAEAVSAGTPGQMRKWKMVTVRFCPVRCNPAAGVLEVVRDGRIVLSYGLEKAEAPAELMADTALDDFAAQAFDNFDGAAAWYPAGGEKSGGTYDYVIMTTETILASTQCLGSLELFHETEHDVLTVTETRTYDNLFGGGSVAGGWGGGAGDVAAENLRSWLQSHWVGMGIKYVLLVGDPNPDTGDLPMKRFHILLSDLAEPKPPHHGKPSDTYYGEMHGNWDLNNDNHYGMIGIDDKPGGLDTVLDLVVGRIPVYSGDALRVPRLESIVAKTIRYATEADINWRKKVLLPAEDLDAETTGVPLMEAIRTEYAIPAGMSTYRVYKDPADGGDISPVNYDNVLNEWKKGYGVVCWSTHGNTTFATDVFDWYLCPDLDDTKPAFVFQISCDNGAPEEINNLGVCLLRNGAIGTVSATRNLQYIPGSSFMTGASAALMGRHFTKRIIAGHNAGDALFLAREDSGLRSEIEKANNPMGWTNWLALNLYGDPAVSRFDSGSGAPAIIVNPTKINISTAVGHSFATTTAKILPMSPGPLSYDITTSHTWLSVAPDSGETLGESDTLTITANSGGMAVGVYDAFLTVTAPGAPNSPLTVPVRLSVNLQDNNPPSIACDVSSIDRTISAGESLPSMEINVRAVGQGVLHCSASQGAAPASWLSLSPDSGIAQDDQEAAVGVYFDTAGLAPGTHTTVISITGAQTPPPPNAPLSIPVTVRVAPPLAEVLDAPGYEWTTDGDVKWFGTRALSHDGVDAAVPGFKPSGGSKLRTTVQGPGTVRFYWMANLSSGGFMQFLVNGVAEKTQMSSFPWTERTVEVTTQGACVLEWVHAGVVDSQRYGLVDQFSFTPFTGPYMSVNPKKIVVSTTGGEVLRVPVVVSNSGGGTFDLTASETRPELTLENPTATVGAAPHTVTLVFDTTDLATSQTGFMKLNGTGAFNPVVNVPYELEISHKAVPLPAALDAPELAWSHGPGSDTMWIGWNDSHGAAYDGVDAAELLLSSNSQKSVLATTVEGPGRISFAWTLPHGTAESAFAFSVDGVIRRGPISAPTAYAVDGVDLLPGTHQLAWTATGAPGTTSLFNLDQVVWEPHEYIAEVSEPEITVSCQPGQNAKSQTFEVWNAGTGPMEYMVTSDKSWARVSPASGTSSGEHDTVTLSFLTGKLSLGVYTATITVSAVGTAGGGTGYVATIPVTLEVGTKNVLPIEAVTDNTLYQSVTGDRSNGAGPSIIVGKYGASSRRRGLVKFDVAGTLPAGALITDARLQMDALAVEKSTTAVVALRTVTRDWGEGVSSAAAPDDLLGANSTTDDATWIHAKYNYISWSNPGGDFNFFDEVTKTSVTVAGTYTWGPAAGMLSDVQSWYQSGKNNKGWILLANEDRDIGWKRFASSEHTVAAQRPRLIVTFFTSEPATAIVPDVVGKESAQAQQAVVDASLAVGAVTEEYNASVAAGLVIAQDPAGDTPVLLDAVVDLVVSKGPAPVPVPELRGLKPDDVDTALAAAGLAKGKSDTTPSLYEAGLLAVQAPVPGTLVPPGSEVDLWYSSGPGLVDVPDLSGVPESDLRETLAAAWLSVGVVTYENSPTVPPGGVIEQKPAPGERVMTDSEISVVISTGPVFVRVPYLEMSTEAEALDKIASGGLAVGKVTVSVSFTFPDGRIVSQNPPADTMVPEGTPVDLVKSEMPVSVEVPNLAGMPRKDAEQLLEAAMLVPGVVSEAPSNEYDAGDVALQFPAAGTTVPPGSSVDFTVSTGMENCDQYSGTDVPVAFDNGTEESRIAVADERMIVDLNLYVEMQQHDVAQTSLWLQGPDGALVELIAGNLSGGNLFTAFDDEAARPVSGGTAPYSGYYRPNEALSVFDGRATKGDWWLFMDDSAASPGNSCNLTWWDLCITTIDPADASAVAAWILETGRFALMDGDANGCLTLAEMQAKAPAVKAAAFDALDATGDDCVTEQELRSIGDTTPPVITINPPNPQQTQCGVPYVDPGATAVDDMDGDVTAQIVVILPPDTSYPNTFTLTYSVTDSRGNTAMADRTVEVVDTTPPVILLTGGAEVTAGTLEGYTEPGWTATDACGGDVSGAVSVEGTVNSAVPGVYTLTYSVGDTAGNVGGAVRTVTVVDTTPPVITLQGNSTIPWECGAPYTDPGWLATDNVDGDISGNVSATPPNVNALGVYTLGYDVTDAAGNHAVHRTRNVDVMDTLPPSLTLLGNNPVTVIRGDAYVEPGWTASDQCAGDLHDEASVTGTVNTALAGTYTLTYNVTDPAGLSASPLQRTVLVVENQAPVISLLGSAAFTVECKSAYTEPGWNASDPEDGDLAGDVLVDGAVDTENTGVYELTYRVQDSRGLWAESRVRTVTVADTNAPTLSLLGGTNMTVPQGGVYSEPGWNASDACAGSLDNVVLVTGTVNTAVLGPQVLAYSVTDPSGNTYSGANRTVTVVDQTAPVISLLGGTPLAVECHTGFTDPGATASDGPNGLISYAVSGTVNPDQPGSYTLTYTAQDAAGNNAAPVQRVVNVSDKVKPVITLQGAASMRVLAGTFFADPGATASDTCAGTLGVQVSGTVNVNTPATYTLTYTASDPSGNAATPVTRTVVVAPNTDPVISLTGSDDLTVECGGTFTDPGATAQDAEDGDLTSAVVKTGAVDTATPATYTLAYNVADSDGNTAARVTRWVTVQDTLPPVVTLAGLESMTVPIGGGFADPGAGAFDQCSGDISDDVTVGGDTVDVNTPGSYTLSYTVLDGSGLAGFAYRQVVVVAPGTPAIVLNGSSVLPVECGSEFVDPWVVATDPEDGDISDQVVVSGDAVNTAATGDYYLRYDVTDSGGHPAARVYRTVQVVDTTPPVVTLLGAPVINLVVGAVYTEPGATAADVCGGDVSSAVSITGTVNTSAPGAYTLTYRVRDMAGNYSAPVTRLVNVTASGVPVITLNGAASVTVECGETFSDPNATAADAEDGNLTSAIVRTGVVNTAVPGTYTLSYNVTDSAGNAANTVTRTVTVADTAKPVITLAGGAEMTVVVGSAYNEPGASADDACSGELAVAVSGAVDTAAPGDHTLTYTATDPAGNSAVPVTRLVHVVTDDDPVITLNGAAAATVECGGVYTDPGATASDTEDGDLTSAIVKTGAVNTAVPGTYTLAYNVTDSDGNAAAAKTRTVTVADTQKPVITLNGPAAVTVECGAPFTDPGATAADGCSGNRTAAIVKTGTVNTATPGTYTLTYNVSDAAGNAAAAKTRTVTVADTQPPVITLAGDAAVTIQCGDAFTDPGADALDACGGALAPQVSGAVAAGTPGVYTLTYAVSDAAGNAAAPVTRTVTVTQGPACAPPQPEPTVDELLAMLTAQFDTADADGSGGVSFAEASALLARLTQAVFAQVDTDGSGEVSRVEAGLEEEKGGCGCGKKKSAYSLEDWRKMLGDLLLAGMGLAALTLMSGGTRRL